MALTPEPVWNCQSCLPVAASSAMNSPVSLPVNSSSPLASIADQIWKSISGTRHFFSAVSGSIASIWPTGWSAARGSGRFSMNW